MAQQFEGVPGKTDSIAYYCVTNQENFKQYLTNQFFLGARYGDTTLHPNIKIVVFPTPKNTEIIKEHCKMYALDGVRFANFKIFMPDQTSDSYVKKRSIERDPKQENPIAKSQGSRTKQEDSTLNFSSINSQDEEQKISQNSVTSLITDYEKQREKIGIIRDNDAINESHATIKSLLRVLKSQEKHEGSTKKRKSNEADIELAINQKNYSLKKLKSSSSYKDHTFSKQTQ